MDKRDKRSEDDGAVQFGGLFKGLGEIINRLGEIAEKGEGMSRSFESDGNSPGGNPFKAVYGFSVKVGKGGEGMRVEPFGTVNKRKPSGGASSDKESRSAQDSRESREPLVDCFEEQDGFHIVAEMPGVAEKDVKLDFEGQTLRLSAETRDRRYEKEIELPKSYSKDAASVSCNNGLCEIHLR